jgi:AraC family transcriptional regulator
VADAMERAVLDVVTVMRERPGEPLTLDDMAGLARYSKFHFSRAFLRVTGVSPARFLSAVRIEEAKRLLTTTSLTVTEISHRVGYVSAGTFGSRFTSSVGVAPGTYREYGGHTRVIRTEGRPDPGVARFSGIVGDVVHRGTARIGPVFLGLFPSRIPEGRPVRCAVLWRPGRYTLQDVPPGRWHVLAHAVPAGQEERLATRPDALPVSAHVPLTVRADGVVQRVDVALRPIHALDPPVLLALLDVRLAALTSA